MLCISYAALSLIQWCIISLNLGIEHAVHCCTACAYILKIYVCTCCIDFTPVILNMVLYLKCRTHARAYTHHLLIISTTINVKSRRSRGADTQSSLPLTLCRNRPHVTIFSVLIVFFFFSRCTEGKHLLCQNITGNQLNMKFNLRAYVQILLSRLASLNLHRHQFIVSHLDCFHHI